MTVRARYAARCNQFIRQWKLLVILRRGWWTLDQLADQLDCSTRTIRRDLVALQTVPLPIVERRNEDEQGLDEPALWSVGAIDAWPRREATPVKDVA